MVNKEKDPFEQLEQLGSGTTYTAEIADMLERTDMFRDMERSEIDAFARYVQAYKAPVGIQVLVEGGRQNYMFIVVEGKLDILKHTEDKASRKIATVRAGKTIGEMSLLDGLPQSATAVVIEPAVLLLMTKNNFEKFINEQAKAALKVIRKIAILMSLRLHQTSGVLFDYLKD
jgi:CRP/FNR family cyclic AMP-dependent transcriptional regulator